MKRILKAAAVAALGAATLLPSPASAIHGGVGAAAFVGTATLGAGLAAPPAAGKNTTWTLTPGTGVGCDNNPAPGCGAGVGGTVTGDLHVGGLVAVFGTGGHCGTSGGSNGTSGGVTPLTVGSVSGHVRDVGWINSAATLIAFSGDTYNPANNRNVGGIVGLVSAIPPNDVTGGGSCAAGTATTFTVVGGAVVTD